MCPKNSSHPFELGFEKDKNFDYQAILNLCNFITIALLCYLATAEWF